MKFIALTLIASFVLAGCSPKAEEKDFVPNNILPKELSDCRFFSLRDEAGNSMKVARCDKPLAVNKIENSVAEEKFTTEQMCIDGKVYNIKNTNGRKTSTPYIVNNSLVVC